MKKMEIAVLIGFLSIFILNTGFSQTHQTSSQEYGVTVIGGPSVPIMGLSNWYKTTPQMGIQAVYQYNKNVEICLDRITCIDIPMRPIFTKFGLLIYPSIA